MSVIAKVESKIFYRFHVNILLKYCVQCLEVQTHLQQAHYLSFRALSLRGIRCETQ